MPRIKALGCLFQNVEMSDVKENPTTDGASDEKKSSVDDAAISHKSEEEEEVPHLVSGSETLISIAARSDHICIIIYSLVKS